MAKRAQPRPELPPFAVRLKALREGAGLTQEQLADKAGLHLGAVFKLEQGVREPTWATVQALAHALGVGCAAFEGTGAPPADAPKSNLKPPARGRAGPKRG
ncbi:MAG TPA: helix-turn-helix transcriptional regulator [Gemmataceae bacterium]|nr:helix-turn-helix transcriptional regulator [Gemmataceae bacterium]